MVDFTVAIRIYNGENRIPALLDGLRAQVGTEGINWEVVVVDNNSTDNTAKVIQDYQSSWPETYPLKYYFEPVQGAAIARRRAMEEAQGALVGFLDDDNRPAPNWVAAAYSFGQSHPKAGAYGSQILGDFEVEPPENFKRIAIYLPVVERKETICFDTYKKGFPAGAGIVIRKQAWMEGVPKNLAIKGPTGKSVVEKGEDWEAITYIRKAGWEIWHNTEMQIYHRIPKWRLEKEYLLKFFRGMGLCRYHHRMIAYEPWQRPFMTLVYLASDLKKMALYFLQNRSQLDTDLVAACEMELLVSNFISPFYTWKKRYLPAEKQ